MSYSIQSGKPWSPFLQQPDSQEELLRSELGWQDVATGLGKILFAYLLMIVIVGLLIGIGVYGLVAMTNQRPTANSVIVTMWVFWLGLAVVGLLSLYTYVQIFVGKCRCAIHAPERCGAKWYIFACLLCIVIGPVLGVVNSVGITASVDSPEKKAKLQQELVEQMRRGDSPNATVLSDIRRTVTVTQIASTLVSMASSIFFVLFLRAIGSCFEEKRLTTMVDLYLMFSALLIGFTVYQLIFAGLTRGMIPLLIVLGLGGLASGAWYLGLIIYTRILILNKISQIRSPLEF